MGKVVLNVQDLNKVYESGHRALTHISFEVQPGEFVAVIGASGSGKSTLLRCLNGLTECSAGEIYFDQRRIAGDILARKPEDRRKLAMIFQQFNLIGRYSVMSNVLMGKLSETPTFASLFQKFSEEDKKAAIEALKMVGIFDKANERADRLSGGQQQRVAIARALVQEPEILLADEPVSSLDPVNSLAVMGYLKKINKDLGLTVICNLHSISLVKKFSTRVLALKAGRVFFDGSARQLTNEIVTNIYGQSLEYADEVNSQ